MRLNSPCPVVRGVPADARATTLRILDQTLGRLDGAPVRVRLWDQTTWPAAPGDEAPLIALARPSTLREMLLPGTERSLAQAFLTGAFDVEGDLETALSATLPLADVLAAPAAKARLARELVKLPRAPAEARSPKVRRAAKLRGRRHSIARDKEAIRYHYDVSNEFFRLFLGPTMVYSCAYFERPDAPLDEAQTAKLDLVCRKLRLKPGQRLLDVGCGWGSLVMHAARHYGVDATGITLSERQAELAQRRIKEEGLEGSARVEIQDYRETAGTYDAISSVGMFEHVGPEMLPTYFDHAMRLLRPGGTFLNHGIGSVGGVFKPKRSSFISTYVFPDGGLVPIDTTLAAAAGAGFEIRDVENLREHYAITLRHWVRGLEGAREEALRHVSEETYRVWRLYMSGSAASFARGDLGLYQTLLVKRHPDGRTDLPLTRADWYPAATPMTGPRAVEGGNVLTS